MQVAWIHYDRSAILTVQNNVITRNPRIGVSHDGHSVWNLHIRDVERSDEGQYMCQINTARAKTRLGNLHVVGELISSKPVCGWSLIVIILISFPFQLSIGHPKWV